MNFFDRNPEGYFLTLIGLVAMAFGHFAHFDKMIDSGYALVGAALYAFRSPANGTLPSVEAGADLPTLSRWTNNGLVQSTLLLLFLVALYFSDWLHHR